MEAAAPPPPPPSDNDKLPKDFQDALSIIFDKGAEKQSAETTVIPPAADGDSSKEISNVIMQDDTSNFTPMDISSKDTQSSHIEHEQINMELDDQSQYILYTEEHYTQNHLQQSIPVPPQVEPQMADLTTQNIPTPPIQILDAAGNLTQIPGPVLEVGSDFVMLDPEGNRIDNISYTVDQDKNKIDAGKIMSEKEIELQIKRKQELEDLAMLGIDADDLAAQCI